MNKNRKKNRETESTAEAKLKGFLDMIAPSVIQFYTDHYICGNTYRSVWALREYPTATDEQAILRHLGEKDGVTLILCFTYMEQSRGRDTLTAVCGIVFLAFLLLAVMDSLPTKRKRGANGWGIQELLLLDEEGNEISAWHIGGKTSLLIGRDEHKENVDINLQNTEYGGMVDRQHAVLNYAAGQWYIEDLGSRNGVRIQDAKDGKLYQVSKEHPCRINAGDIIFIGNTRLRAK